MNFERVAQRKLRQLQLANQLEEEFLEPMGIPQYRLAKEIGVPAQRIGQIIAGKRSVTADNERVSAPFATRSKPMPARKRIFRSR